MQQRIEREGKKSDEGKRKKCDEQNTHLCVNGGDGDDVRKW